VMPKMGGTELGIRLRSLQPHLKVVYMTGYLEQNDSNRGLMEDACFLQKPFSRETLVAKLVQALQNERVAWPQAHPQAQTLAS